MTDGTRTAPAARTVPVLDSTMTYLEAGAGKPIVFLHGNPTSSYLWRNVMPHLTGLGRCLAPDLIGMGRSGKNPSGSYRFVDHARYLDAWFEAVGVARDAVLVVHDWGSALGFHWARRHPDRVCGIAYMEAIVTPVTWADWPESARKIFQAMRSPAGEELVLDKNVFVERILPASILRTLSQEEHDSYRAPFREPGEGRAARRSPGRARSRSRGRRKTFTKSSPPMARGWRRAPCPSFSSMPSPARSWSAASATSAALGRTRQR